MSAGGRGLGSDCRVLSPDPANPGMDRWDCLTTFPGADPADTYYAIVNRQGDMWSVSWAAMDSGF